MAEGSGEEWELAPGDRRRGGPLHDDMAQGRGAKGLATPHSGGRQEQQPRVTGGAGGGEAVLIQLYVVDECRNEMVDRVARYHSWTNSEWSVCYYSPEPSTTSGRICFVFVEFNGGSAKATVRPFLTQSDLSVENGLFRLKPRWGFLTQSKKGWLFRLNFFRLGFPTGGSSRKA